MSHNLDAMLISVERRYAEQIGYSIQMMSAIVAEYNNALDSSEFLFARSMLDSFYVHARLMADFLVKRTSNLDFGPADFGVDWAAPPLPETDRLHVHWRVASSYVVHFGRLRVPGDPTDLKAFRVDGEAFREITTDVLKLFSFFMVALQAATPEWSGGAWIPDARTQPGLFRARLLSDRLLGLRKIFLESCETIGINGEALLERQ